MNDARPTPEGTSAPRTNTDCGSQLRIIGQYPVDLESEFPYLFLTLRVRVIAESATTAPRQFTKCTLPFLVAARDFLDVLLSSAFDDGFIARIDVSGENRIALDCQGTFFDPESEYVALTKLTELVAAPRVERLDVFPINISLFRVDQPSAESFVDLFKKLRFDQAIMRTMFESGVVRIAITEQYGDLVASPNNTTKPLRWLDEVRSHFGERVSWGVES